MVPDAYTAFFAAGAGVAGALIGLLFVAISVGAGATDPDGRLEFDVRAGRAFSALTDALVLSLFALIPGGNLGSTALVVAVLGIGTCVALGIMLLRATGVVRRTSQLAWLGVQGLLFVYQGILGARLMAHPHDQSSVRSLATLTVVFLLVGMARAWQLIGARDTGLLTVVRGVVHDRKAPPPGP